MPDRDFTAFSADEWEAFLETHPEQVLMFVDEDHQIHTIEWDNGLSFVQGGSYGYDYEGSRATLEAFCEDPSEVFKVLPRELESEERQRLKDGHWDTPQEWAGIA